MRGMIGGVSHEAVVGWAVFDNTDEPVSIEPRVLVPRVKREDHRYLSDEPLQDEAKNDA